MTIDERLERLTGIVESLAASVVSHDERLKSIMAAAKNLNRHVTPANSDS